MRQGRFAGLSRKVLAQRAQAKVGKEPLVKSWQEVATTDARQLRDWWRKWPEAVPGIELGRAGLIMIDPDRHAGKADGVAEFAELVANNVPLPKHPIAKTAGDGEHHYFKQWPGETFGNSEGRLRGKEINVRGKGGWAVAPGSIRSDGKRWGPAGLTTAFHEGKIPILPDWLAAMIRQPKPKPETATPNGANRAHQVNGATSEKPRPVWSATEESKVKAAIAHIRADTREAWLKVGMALHSTGWPQAREVWDSWSQTEPGAFDAADQDKTWLSFDRAYNGTPVTLASLFGLAIEGGYRDTAQPPDAEAAPSITDTALESVCAATIVMAAVDWLWPDRFALGKLGLLVGLPDEGKGQIFAYMAAQVTCGGDWPCDEGRAIKGKVLMLGAEDDDSDTVVPRLVAAGADLTQIEIVHMVCDTKKRMFSLVTDLELLRQKIKQVGDVKLVLIDPISAYLGVGKVDSFRTTDVRAVLAPLVDLAAELKVAIVGIMHFNKKVDVTNALLRISDSLAFGATARHVFAVVDDAENKRKLLVRGKNNLATHNIPALAYNFGVREVGTDPNTKKAITAPYILWYAKHVDVTATEAMQATRSPAARDEAKKFLSDLLSAGPMPRKEIDDAAEGNGISERTLFRAKAELNVIARRIGGSKGSWSWQLPDQRSLQTID
jgi:putative DNA primase/helicase